MVEALCLLGHMIGPIISIITGKVAGTQAHDSVYVGPSFIVDRYLQMCITIDSK